MAAYHPENPAQPKRRQLGKQVDAAVRLNCSLDTVARYIKQGLIPVVRLPSGRIRVDLDELDRRIAEDWTEAR